MLRNEWVKGDVDQGLKEKKCRWPLMTCSISFWFGVS